MEDNTVVLERPANYGTAPDYDGLWKALIEELFEEFMQFFAPDLYDEIDFSKGSEFLNKELLKEFINEKKGRVEADQIVKVCLKNGHERWILIHIEVQGKTGKGFAKRMFRYFYRIYDKHNQEVYAIALLTDTEQAIVPNHFHYSFFGTELDYRYNVYSFHNQSIKKLEASSNPFSDAVIAGIYAGKTRHDANRRYAFKRKLMIQILQSTPTQPEHTRTYLSALFHFIDNILQVSNELEEKLEEDIIPYIRKGAEQQMLAGRKSNPWTKVLAEFEEKGLERGLERGIEKGIAKGREEAAKDFAKELIRKDFQNEQIMELTKLDLVEVEKLRESL
ncbi:hypothetical protein CFK37_08675 [Virgibacillus phasianinus]|uniref:Transposase (putative) YhgA-like domain-containing protein n=1 Tax=Virgibacillus phasianinus TaxID=2017483 RepID=A0A220U2B4_9BACI|nr:Rpn family recombination-promoting nuclease/putative transposase [Virgibacillus phasianinus]ASK62230.1 hypothetical protein CFK37_08675 [Virgibacillus phasianinus]